MTTPRPLARMRRAAGLLIAAAGLLALAGCDPRALLYFLQPNEPTIAPEYTGSLKGKRVVLLTHAVSAAQGESLAIDRELARELVPLLREKIKKVDVVDPSKVWDWAEAHPSWTDPAEAARAFEADAVIFLEVEGFQIADPSSPGLYQGVSRVHIQMTELKHPVNSKGKPMTDQPREAEVVFDSYRDTQFPSRGHMPDTGISRASFKNKFLKEVAMEVSWHFVSRAHGDDIQDTRIYK